MAADEFLALLEPDLRLVFIVLDVIEVIHEHGVGRQIRMLEEALYACALRHRLKNGIEIF